jgi:hypothetical protein
MNNVCYLHHNCFLIFEQRLYIFFYFAPLTRSTVSITLKRVSKRSSMRYRFQEHFHKFLMLVATHSE